MISFLVFSFSSLGKWWWGGGRILVKMKRGCACLCVQMSLVLMLLFHFQSAVLSVMGDLSATGKVTTFTSNMLINAKSQLKKLQVSCKLLHVTFYYYL